MKHRLPAVLLVALTLLSGCRMYGGYGSEEATRAVLTSTVSAFAQELTTMEALQSQVASTDQAAAFDQALTLHRSVVKHQQEHVLALAETGSYRTLSRALGAAVAEQERVHMRYEEVADAIANGTVQAFGRSYYTIYPAAWVGWWHNDATVSVRDALRWRS